MTVVRSPFPEKYWHYSPMIMTIILAGCGIIIRRNWLTDWYGRHLMCAHWYGDVVTFNDDGIPVLLTLLMSSSSDPNIIIPYDHLMTVVSVCVPAPVLPAMCQVADDIIIIDIMRIDYSDVYCWRLSIIIIPHVWWRYCCVIAVLTLPHPKLMIVQWYYSIDDRYWPPVKWRHYYYSVLSPVLCWYCYWCCCWYWWWLTYCRPLLLVLMMMILCDDDPVHCVW